MGGGVAGLIAARDLGEQGARVIVLEARERLGGRVWCRPFAGFQPGVELGGNWFDADAQPALHAEADRYGIEFAHATKHANVRWFTGGQTRAALPVPLDEMAAFERLIVELHTAARAFDPNSPESIEALDLPWASWLESLNPTPAARDFLFGWTSLMSGADPMTHPALGPIGTIAHQRNAFAYYTELVDVFPSGTSSLVGAIANDINGEIRTGTPVTAIRQSGNGVKVETADDTFHAKACVLAVPVNVMASIAMDPPFEPARMAPLEQGHSCHMLKLWMLATGVPDRMLGAGWGSPFYWLSAEHRLQEPDGVQIVVAFALQGAIDPTDRDAVEAALRCYAPEASVLAVDCHDWNSDPWARGGWLSPPPGWASAGVRQLLRQPHGRIIMAGSDVAPEHGGWIAGAVTSGHLAATQALAIES